MTIAEGEWLDGPAAAGWVDAELDRLGLARAGDIEQVHARPWSAVWRIPTRAETVWFKANGGQTRYEAALAEALGRWVPERVLVPLAVDAERGWQLMPDAGDILRHTEHARDLRQWEAFIATYAQLQRDLAAHTEEMLTLRVPDHRPQQLPDLVAKLVGDESIGLAPASRERILARLDEFRHWCGQLAASGIEPSLNHDDLHDANVVVRASGFAFFDWGDSSVAHPFTTLLVTLRVVADKFELAADDPQVLRVRDAYLEAFGAEHDAETLRELARWATWTGKPGRALSWQRALASAAASAGEAELAEWSDSVAGWLEELLEPGPL